MYSSGDPTRDPAYIPFTERPPDTRAVRAAFANEVGTLMDELARAADRTRHKGGQARALQAHAADQALGREALAHEAQRRRQVADQLASQLPPGHPPPKPRATAGVGRIESSFESVTAQHAAGRYAFHPAVHSAFASTSSPASIGADGSKPTNQNYGSGNSSNGSSSSAANNNNNYNRTYSGSSSSSAGGAPSFATSSPPEPTGSTYLDSKFRTAFEDDPRWAMEKETRQRAEKRRAELEAAKAAALQRANLEEAAAKFDAKEKLTTRMMSAREQIERSEQEAASIAAEKAAHARLDATRGFAADYSENNSSRSQSPRPGSPRPGGGGLAYNSSSSSTNSPRSSSPRPWEHPDTSALEGGAGAWENVLGSWDSNINNKGSQQQQQLQSQQYQQHQQSQQYQQHQGYTEQQSQQQQLTMAGAPSPSPASLPPPQQLNPKFIEAADGLPLTWEQKEAQRAASHLEWQQQQWQQQQDKLRQRDQLAMSPRASPRSSPRLPDPSELYTLPTTQWPGGSAAASFQNPPNISTYATKSDPESYALALQKEARMAGNTVAPTPHRPPSAGGGATATVSPSHSDLSGSNHSSSSSSRQQEQQQQQQGMHPQSMSPPYPPPPHPSAHQTGADQHPGTNGQGTGSANTRGELGYNYFGAPVPYHLPHGATGTGVLAHGNRTGEGPPLLLPGTLGAPPAPNLQLFSSDGTYGNNYGGGSSSSSSMVTGASGVIAPWDREGDAQGGALSFGLNLAASDTGGFFPSAQRLVLWLVTRAQPSLGTFLQKSSPSPLSVAGAGGRWTSSIIALLKVATPELLRSGDTVRWHGPYGSDSRRITAAAQRGDPQAAAFLTASTAQQAGRGLSGPSPGGMGAQGEFVKYEPLGGAYSMWRPEGGGSSDADGAPTDGGGGSTGLGEAFEGLSGDPFSCVVVARVGFGNHQECLVPLHELSKNTVYSPGETVTWCGGADDAVPRGTIGEVLGYNERGRVRVRFPKGTWNFLPAELRKEADRGASSSTLAFLEDITNEILGRFFVAAAIMATSNNSTYGSSSSSGNSNFGSVYGRATSKPTAAQYRAAVALCLPGDASPSSSSSSYSHHNGSDVSSGRLATTLSARALAGFDLAVRHLQEAYATAAAADEAAQSAAAALAAGMSPFGAGDSNANATLQRQAAAAASASALAARQASLPSALGDRARTLVDPSQVMAAAAAANTAVWATVLGSGGSGGSGGGSGGGGSSSNSPSSSSSPSNLGNMGEFEASGLAGALEVVIGTLVSNASKVAKLADPRSGVVLPAHVNFALKHDPNPAFRHLRLQSTQSSSSSLAMQGSGNGGAGEGGSPRSLSPSSSGGHNNNNDHDHGDASSTFVSLNGGGNQEDHHHHKRGSPNKARHNPNNNNNSVVSAVSSYSNRAYGAEKRGAHSVVALATAGRRSPFREAVGSPKSLNPLSPDQAQQQLNPNHEPMSPQGFTSSAASNTTAAGNNSNAAGSGNGGGGGGTSSTSNTAPPARSWQVGSFRRGSGNGGSGGNDNEDENDGPDLDNAAGIQAMRMLEEEFEECKRATRKDYPKLKALKHRMEVQRELNNSSAEVRADLSAAELREEFDTCEALVEKLSKMPRTFEDWEQQQAEQKAAEEAEAAAAEAAEAARLAAEQKAARGQLSSFSQRNNSTTSRHVRLPGDPDYPNSSTSTGGAGGGSSSRVSAFSRVSGATRGILKPRTPSPRLQDDHKTQEPPQEPHSEPQQQQPGSNAQPAYSFSPPQHAPLHPHAHGNFGSPPGSHMNGPEEVISPLSPHSPGDGPPPPLPQQGQLQPFQQGMQQQDAQQDAQQQQQQQFQLLSSEHDSSHNGSNSSNSSALINKSPFARASIVQRHGASYRSDSNTNAPSSFGGRGNSNGASFNASVAGSGVDALANGRSSSITGSGNFQGGANASSSSFTLGFMPNRAAATHPKAVAAASFKMAAAAAWASQPAPPPLPNKPGFDQQQQAQSQAQQQQQQEMDALPAKPTTYSALLASTAGLRAYRR